MVKDIDTDNFVQLFRELWHESGLTLGEIADTAGVSRPTVYSWSVGNYFPKLELLCYVLDAMGYKLQVTEKWRDERE